jgi:hypothetical protein
MRRTIVVTASIALFAALALQSPGWAVAGPSEGASEMMTMAIDDVAEGLRKYRKEKDPEKRRARLQKLAATGDARVALALVDAANNRNGDDLDCEAADLLWWYYASPAAAAHRGQVNRVVVRPPTGDSFRPWWKANEADIRRRTARLPR